jgi:hypothetical protein
MSEDNNGVGELAQPAAQTWMIKPARWACPVHGETALVITLRCPGCDERTYCAPCLINFLDRLGLVDIPRVY